MMNCLYLFKLLSEETLKYLKIWTVNRNNDQLTMQQGSSFFYEPFAISFFPFPDGA